MQQNCSTSTRRSFKFVALFIFLLNHFNASGQSADIILSNGNIFTADTSKLYVQAIAIKGNRVLAVGRNQDIKKFLTSRTKKIDLQGATVVPGFNNAHDHPMFLSPVGKYYTDEALSVPGLSRRQLIDSVAKLALKAHHGEWISGTIGLTILDDTAMRRTLDSLAPKNPVYLQVWWGHGSVVNESALKALGISDLDPDPSGGWYAKNSRNQITALHENAQAPVWITHPSSSSSVAMHHLTEYGRQQIEHGMTSVQYMGTGIDPTDPSKPFKELSKFQRVRLIKWASNKRYRIQKGNWNSTPGIDRQMFKISGVKYLVDGTPMEGNAFIRQSSSAFHGRLNYPIDTLRQIIKGARDGNDQLVLHAVGDSAVATVVSIMKELASPDLWRKKRVRIEHNAVTRPSEQLKKDLREMGILSMHTPKYAHSSPVKSLINAGVLVGISPDGSTNPFMDIVHITSRQDDASENISREEAVIAYTYTNAFAEFEEGAKGRLMPGMLADLVVLTKNMFTVSLEELPKIKSQLTIVDGKIVYSALQSQ